MSNASGIILHLESLPLKKRRGIKKASFDKALADLPPLERGNVERAINDIQGIPECGIETATEIVAALGMFLDQTQKGVGDAG